METARSSEFDPHVDPLDPTLPKPDWTGFSARRKAAYQSHSMSIFRQALSLPGAEDVRAAVLDDLGVFYQCSPEECVSRCVNWKAWSIDEWQRRERDCAERLTEFYDSKAWSFNLLWYAYLQSEGYAYPASVAIAENVRSLVPAGRQHLDFGSGIGATGQLFSRLGYESTLADISTSLLTFAKFRLERRSDEVKFLDLKHETLEPGRYDVITAIDTLVHVPDLPRVLQMLHAALKPGGWLFANFDTRPPTDPNAWHLYSDDLPLRWRLHRTGFEPREKIDWVSTRYERVEPGEVMHLVRSVRDLVLLRSPLRPLYRASRAQLQQWIGRLTESRRSAPSPSRAYSSRVGPNGP